MENYFGCIRSYGYRNISPTCAGRPPPLGRTYSDKCLQIREAPAPLRLTGVARTHARVELARVFGGSFNIIIILNKFKIRENGWFKALLI